MSCFHCSANWRYVSAYYVSGGGGGANPAAPLPGYAPVSSNIFAYSDFLMYREAFAKLVIAETQWQHQLRSHRSPAYNLVRIQDFLKRR